MPTVAELERLQALVNQLIPLSQMERGTLIRAQDWNDVVGALIEVAQVALAESREPVIPTHDHADQVSVNWLDNRLRDLVQRGPLADPAALARVTTLERHLERATSQLEALNGRIKDVGDRVTDVSSRDLAREAEITTIRRTIDGLADARDDIITLRETLRAIQRNLKTAMQLSTQLEVDGELVDMEVYNKRLQAVEEVRQRMTTPDGELLDAASYERRLTELRNTLVTADELEEALANRPGQIPEDVLAELEDRISNSLREEFNGSLEQLGADLRDEINKRLAAAISDALPDLRDSVIEEVRGEIETAVSEGMAETRQSLEGQLAETAESLRAEFNEQLEGVSAGIQQTVQTEVERQLSAQLGAIQEEIAALDARLTRLEEMLEEMVVAQVKAEVGQMLDQLREEMRAIAREEIERSGGGSFEPIDTSIQDDFTLIDGIGLTFAQRLESAGVRTFTQLAQMSTEEVAQILQTTPTRVESENIIGQAKMLAENG